MYSALVFVAVAVFSVSAQAPQHCVTPPAWRGTMFEMDTRRTFRVIANITYDATNQRFRIDESLARRDEPREYYDTIILFKERVQYKINVATKACVKSTLPEDEIFHPIEVPADATSQGEAVIGSDAYPGTGVIVDLWSGTSTRGGRYFGSVTAKGCIPVQEIHTLDSGDVLRRSFYNFEEGYNPNFFIPPSNCQGGL